MKKHGVHTAFTRKLTLRELEDVAALFNNIRSDFKKSMREQVKAWRPGQYDLPLSKKQLAYVIRSERDQYGRPNALARKRAALEALPLGLKAELASLRGFRSA